MKRLTATAVGSIVGGILFHLAVLTVVRIEAPISRVPFEDDSEVRYVGDLTREVAPSILQQAALFDSAPLFMPTRWNPSSQMAEVASLKEATEIFDRFPAQLRLPASQPRFPEARPLAAPAMAYPSGPAFVLARYGREPSPSSEAVSSGTSVRVRRLAGSGPEAVTNTVLPRAMQGLGPPALWTPVQFYLQVSEGTPVGSPMLAQSSGFAEWDQALQGFIGSLGFYRQLEDGYYHLLVYP